MQNKGAECGGLMKKLRVTAVFKHSEAGGVRSRMDFVKTAYLYSHIFFH